MTAKQVVVIGAGAGGVSATYNLRRKGVDVVCVEASDHIGGRASSYDKNGYLCEVGAVCMETYWVKSHQLLEASGLAEKMHYPEVSRLGFWRKGRWNMLSTGGFKDQLHFLPDTLRFRGMPLKAMLAAPKFLSATNKEVKKITAAHSAAGDFSDLHHLTNMSIRDFALAHGGEVVDDYIANPMISFMVVGDSADCCAAHIVALTHDNLKAVKTSKEAGIKDAGFAASMERGLSSYLRAAAAVDEDAYLLSNPVSKVVVENGKVKGVETAQGFIETEHVICTTTASKALQIIPDLTPAIRAMLGTVKYSRLYNVIIGERYRFAPVGFYGGLFPRTDPMPTFRSIFNSGISSAFSNPHGGDLMHFYTSYTHDEKLKAMTEPERRRFLLAEARTLFPKISAEPDLFEIIRHDEGICLDAPGQMPAFIDYEKNHLDDIKGLNLAGEYGYPLASTEGSMHSVGKAVDRVLAQL